jgi:diguanylate cyclase (GGDEF)-like protein
MMNGENLEGVLRELRQALYVHEEWHKELMRTLVCRLPHDSRDTANDAHRRCGFGRWYYGSPASSLRAHAVFATMDVEHEHMHRLAAQLLKASDADSGIAPEAYDHFANALDRLRLQIHTLICELEDSLVHHDSLTGAESRIDMLTKLAEMRALGKRQHHPCCIALMDVDHFKRINDTHGHLVGDQVLKACVRYLRGHLRPYDHVFRYGGEEFLILMPDTDLDAGRRAIERIREGLAAAPLAQDGQRAISATASFGVAVVEPVATIEESLDHADKMMYAAKKAGRNCVRVWAPAGAAGGG